MTDTTDTAAETPVDDPAQPDAPNDSDQTPQPDSGNDSPEGDTPEGESPNAEAARYRVKLREVETERDQLAKRLTEYRRREVEAAITDVLDVPSDLWEVGQVDVASLYNDDGTLNATDALGAAAALADQRPRLAKPKQAHRNWGQHGAAPPGVTQWQSIIQS